MFDGRLVDEGFYLRPEFEGYEESGKPFRVLWKALSDFGPQGARLYPDGLLEAI